MTESLPQENRIDFKKVVREGCYSLHLKSTTKKGIIEELIDLLVAAGKLKDRESAFNSVLEREMRMSTGMQCGIAVPHGKTSTVTSLVTAFALRKEGADFASLDGQPSRIFIMTISPSDRTGPHMQYLAEVSKLLSSPTMREKILSAGTAEEIVEILTKGNGQNDSRKA